MLDVALHFGPEDHSCAEKLNKNNDQVGRETLQLFKSGQDGRAMPLRTPTTGVIGPLFKAARVALPPNIRDADAA